MTEYVGHIEKPKVDLASLQGRLEDIIEEVEVSKEVSRVQRWRSNIPIGRGEDLPHRTNEGWKKANRRWMVMPPLFSERAEGFPSKWRQSLNWGKRTENSLDMPLAVTHMPTKTDQETLQQPMNRSLAAS